MINEWILVVPLVLLSVVGAVYLAIGVPIWLVLNAHEIWRAWKRKEQGQ